jgi:hypothetical protein
MNTQAVVSIAVECFDLCPEDEDAVLRFGMKLEDMEPQPPTVDNVMEEVSLWYADPNRAAPGVTTYDNWKMLRDRLTKVFNPRP